jgi:hypothetical protein
MLDNLAPSSASLRLYQVSYETWIPPVIVAASAPERAAAIATYGRPPVPGSPGTIVIDVTDEFVALSSIAASHVRALISGKVEGVVSYDAEDGWAYDALR